MLKSLIRTIEFKLFNKLENETSNDKTLLEENVSKNKWLYSSDKFGQMNRGVEYDSNTYNYENFYKENDFEIL
jgi:hypothetical protein